MGVLSRRDGVQLRHVRSGRSVQTMRSRLTPPRTNICIRRVRWCAPITIASARRRWASRKIACPIVLLPQSATIRFVFTPIACNSGGDPMDAPRAPLLSRTCRTVIFSARLSQGKAANVARLPRSSLVDAISRCLKSPTAVPGGTIKSKKFAPKQACTICLYKGSSVRATTIRFASVACSFSTDVIGPTTCVREASKSIFDEDLHSSKMRCTAVFVLECFFSKTARRPAVMTSSGTRIASSGTCTCSTFNRLSAIALHAAAAPSRHGRAPCALVRMETTVAPI
jgi:hypothetical protein